jgi:hypothetical protein
MTWTNLSVGGGNVLGVPPAPRGGLGLAFAEGGLYVFGGWSGSGGMLASRMSELARYCALLEA